VDGNRPSQGGHGFASMAEGQAGEPMIDVDRDTAFSQQILDVLNARSKASLHNIANQNVDGFKRYVVRFEDLLKKAQADGRDPNTVQPVTERDESGPPGQNNVVLMEELAILGKTSLLHDVMTRRVGSYFQTINKAIFGR
jgi:flagellar basal body rod protein FlgB